MSRALCPALFDLLLSTVSSIQREFNVSVPFEAGFFAGSGKGGAQKRWTFLSGALFSLSKYMLPVLGEVRIFRCSRL